MRPGLWAGTVRVTVSGTLVAVVLVALLFDFTNGFHDTANAIATSVATKALSPRMAVAFAGLLNSPAHSCR